ncbi:MAG: Uma2 family endonuclease [Acidimicrobiales bacterium]
MRTVVLDPLPFEVEQLVERRKRLGLDLHDEVWEGTYHMAPAARFRHGDLDQQLAVLLDPLARRAGLVTTGPFNLGQPGDFRVPDRGLHRGRQDPEAVYLETAAVVVEIVSPGDETWDKLPFYAAHGVDEVMVVDPAERRIRLLVLAGDSYRDAEASALLGVPASDLEAAVRWP